MRFFLIIIGLLGCGSSSIATKTIEIQQCELICWNQNRRLSWDDFTGEPDVFETSVGQATAVTVAKVNAKGFMNDGKPDFIVTNHFVKKSSWVKNRTDLGLQHEQLHFDIAELCARKIRKGINNLRQKGVTVLEKYTDLINTCLKERDKLDAQYDNETAHSLLEDQQLVWNEKIKNELLQLAEYHSQVWGCECEEAQN